MLQIYSLEKGSKLMNEKVKSKVLIRILESGLYDTDYCYPLYLNRITSQLGPREEFSYEDWCNLIPLLDIRKESYYLFKSVWLEAYVRFSFLPSILNQDIPDYNKHLAEKIIKVDDLKYTDVLRLKLAYVCSSIEAVDTIYNKLIENEYVEQWKPYWIIKNLDLLWDVGFTRSSVVFDSILSYVPKEKYTLDSMKNIYYGTNNEQDFYNVFMFTVNCINQDCETRFSILDMMSTYQKHVANKEGFPDNEFLGDVFSNATLFKYLNVQAFTKLIRYTALKHRLQKVDKDFTKFEESTYYEEVYSGIIEECKQFYNTGSELFKYLYNDCKNPVYRGNMTFYSQGYRDYHIDTVVNRDLLSFGMRYYCRNDLDKIISSLYSTYYAHFTVEEFIKVVNSYAPEYNNDDALAYIWTDAYIKYYYIQRVLSFNFERLCNIEKLRFLVTPEVVFNRSLFTAVIHYCKDVPCSMERDIESGINEFYSNMHLQQWLKCPTSKSRYTLQDTAFNIDEGSIKSISKLGNLLSLHKTSFSEIAYLLPADRASAESVFKLKLFLDALLEDYNLVNKEGIAKLIQSNKSEIVPVFESVVGNDLQNFTTESLPDILEFCALCEVVYGHDLDHVKCTLNDVVKLKDEYLVDKKVQNKAAAELFFGAGNVK